MRDFVAAAVQMNSGEEVSENLRAAEALIRQAVEGGAELVLLPENFALMAREERRKLEVAEPFGEGPIQNFLAETASRFGIYLAGGTLPLKSETQGKVRAACLIYGPGGELLGRYDKIHLFDVELPTATASLSHPPHQAGHHLPRHHPVSGERYRESATIEPGDRPLLLTTPLARIGVAICYDIRFPELARRLSREGMELLLVPAAFTVPTGRAHFEVLLRARAIENQCYLVAAAQWGEHPGGRRTFGHSMVVDPWGEVVARLEEGNGVVLARLEASRLSEIRSRFPALEHRRLEL